jgi:hypothetical protein
MRFIIVTVAVVLSTSTASAKGSWLGSIVDVFKKDGICDRISPPSWSLILTRRIPAIPTPFALLVTPSQVPPWIAPLPPLHSSALRSAPMMNDQPL